MRPTLIEWDKKRVPSALKRLKPGRYTIVPADELTPAEEAAVERALDELEAGKGMPLSEALAKVRRSRKST